MFRWQALLVLKTLFLAGLLFAQTAAYAHIAEYHHEGHHHGHSHEQHDDESGAECEIQILASEDQYILPAPPADIRYTGKLTHIRAPLAYAPQYMKPPTRGPPVRGPPLSHQ